MEIKTGLWAKQSKNGNTYYSGKIKINDKEYKLQLFKTETKKSEKSPDYTLFIRDGVISQEETKTVEIPPKNELDDQVFADFGSKIDLTEDENLLPF